MGLVVSMPVVCSGPALTLSWLQIYCTMKTNMTWTLPELVNRTSAAIHFVCRCRSRIRYHLTNTTFVEPQAELILGRLQGQTFNWNDSGMDVAMRRNSVNPLVGRTGVVSGKTFSGKDWESNKPCRPALWFDLTDSADGYLDTAGEPSM